MTKQWKSVQPLQEFKYLGGSLIRGVKLPNGNAKFTHDCNGDVIDHSLSHMARYLDTEIDPLQPVEVEEVYNFADTVKAFEDQGFRPYKTSTYRGDSVLLMVWRKDSHDIRVVAVRDDGAAFGLQTSDTIYNEFSNQADRTSIKLSIGEIRVLREVVTQFDFSQDDGMRAWAVTGFRPLVNKITNALPDDEIEKLVVKRPGLEHPEVDARGAR